jgi:hypothetical protein
VNKSTIRNAVLTSAVAVLASASLASANTIIYQTGFESPDYSLGNLIGQNNWQQFDADLPFANVTVQDSIVRPITGGSQAVKFQPMGPSADPYTDFTDVWSSDSAVSSAHIANEPIVRIQWDMMREALSTGSGAAATTGGGAWGIDVYDTNANNLALTISVYDDMIGPGISGTDESLAQVFLDEASARGTWDTYAVEIDYTSRTYTVFINGNLVGSPLALNAAADNGIGDVDFLSWTRGTDSAYFDNLLITTNAVPEPASLSLVAAAGMLLARRRRS